MEDSSTNGAQPTETHTNQPSAKDHPLAGLKLLTAADILGAPTTVWEYVEVPEWGGQVLVRSLSGTERDSFEAGLVIKRGKTRDVSTENIRAKLVAASVVDHTDPDRMRPAFTSAQVAQLGSKSAAALSRVYDVASRLSGLSESDVEELAGNSRPAVSAG